MVEKREGMKRFYAAHTEAFRKYALPLAGALTEDKLSDKDKKKMIAVLSGELMTPLTATENLSDENRVLLWLNIRFGEIYDSVEYLRDALVYIKSFPYEGTRITKVRYFRYVVENFLREIYTLDQRLKKFAQRVAEEYERIPKKHFRQSEAYKAYNEAHKKFEKQTADRHILVHDSRDFDTQLYNLTQLEQRVTVTFVGTPFLDIFESLLERKYSCALNERSYEMEQIVCYIEEIADVFFVGINAMILNENGDIRFPK